MAVNPVVEDPTAEDWRPTRKFLSAVIVTVAVYVITRFTELDKDTEQLVNVLAPLIAAFAIRNKPTIEGKGL